jgi:heme/copper-type cytochrome/quinol oxidase subunit 3
MSAELASESADYAVVEREPPGLLGRNLRTAGHLLASATIFFFVSFLFAFFYLRSLDNAGLWRPKGVTPPVGFGTAILLVMVASAVLAWLALGERRAAGPPPSDQARIAAWRLRGALALGLVAVVLQCIEWATMGFGPASGGYASVFVGWTGLLVVFALGAMYWLETLLATSFRYRGTPTVEPGEAAGDAHREAADLEDAIGLTLPGLEAFCFFWTATVGVAVLAFVLLYLVK